MKYITPAIDAVKPYVNQYTVGAAATAALTVGAYFVKGAAFSVANVSGLGLLSLTAVAGSYALFLGAKSAYNFVTGAAPAVNPETNKPAQRVTRSMAKKLAEEAAAKVEADKNANVITKGATAVKNSVSNGATTVKNSVTSGAAAVSNTASNVVEGTKSRFSNAIASVKNWWNGAAKADDVKADDVKADEAKADEAKADEVKAAPKKAAAKVAPKATAKVAPKTFTPALKKAQAAAKKSNVIEIALQNRPRRACANYK